MDETVINSQSEIGKTIANQLLDLSAIKQNIKISIENWGQDMSGVPFSQYSEKIDAIQLIDDEDNSVGIPKIFPIYQQENEPENKNGLWIKTSEKIGKIYIGNEKEPIGNHEWIKYPSLEGIKRCYNMEAYDDDTLYLFGSSPNISYIYHPLDNVYTELPEQPELFCTGAFCQNEFFALTKEGQGFYKYNIDTNLITRLPDTPGSGHFNYWMYTQVLCFSKEYIILRRITNDSNKHKVYIYNSISNIITDVSDIFLQISFSTSYFVKKDNYLFAVPSTSNNWYWNVTSNYGISVYNILNNLSRQFFNIPNTSIRYQNNMIFSKMIPYENTSFFAFACNGYSSYTGYMIYNFHKFFNNGQIDYSTETLPIINNIVMVENLRQGVPSVNFPQWGAVTDLSTLYNIQTYASTNTNIWTLSYSPVTTFNNTFNVSKYRVETDYPDGIYLFFGNYTPLGGEMLGMDLNNMAQLLRKVTMFKNNQQKFYDVYIGNGSTWEHIYTH